MSKLKIDATQSSSQIPMKPQFASGSHLKALSSPGQDDWSGRASVGRGAGSLHCPFNKHRQRDFAVPTTADQ